MGCLYSIAVDAQVKYNLRFKQELQTFFFVCIEIMKFAFRCCSIWVGEGIVQYILTVYLGLVIC